MIEYIYILNDGEEDEVSWTAYDQNGNYLTDAPTLDKLVGIVKVIAENATPTCHDIRLHL